MEVFYPARLRWEKVLLEAYLLLLLYFLSLMNSCMPDARCAAKRTPQSQEEKVNPIVTQAFIGHIQRSR